MSTSLDIRTIFQRIIYIYITIHIIFYITLRKYALNPLLHNTGKGLIIFATAIEGDYFTEADKYTIAKRNIKQCMENNDATGFVKVHITKDIKSSMDGLLVQLKIEINLTIDNAIIRVTNSSA